jgi:ATP-dependent Clp protease adaptor protein ClpS
MSTLIAPAEVEVEQPVSEEDFEYDRPWVVIVWNDPINLMSYVTLVFQTLSRRLHVGVQAGPL